MEEKKNDGLNNEKKARRNTVLLSEDLVLKTAAIAYQNELLREMEEIANDPNAPDMSPEAAEELHNNVMKMFAEKRKQQTRQLILRRTLQVVACFAAVVVVGLFVAFQVDASRSGISNFLINTFSKYAEVQYDAQSCALPPVGWESPYYPLWLPEGTRVKQVLLEEQGQYIWYQDRYGHEFAFAVLPQASQDLRMDSEGMVCAPVTVSGKDATLAHNADGSAYSLVLATPQNALMIDGALSESDIVKIAENLSKYE